MRAAEAAEADDGMDQVVFDAMSGRLRVGVRRSVRRRARAS